MNIDQLSDNPTEEEAKAFIDKYMKQKRMVVSKKVRVKNPENELDQRLISEAQVKRDRKNAKRLANR